MRTVFYLLLVALTLSTGAASSAYADLKPPTTVSGYIARICINEVPFPGERGWVSEADTVAGMIAVLWVLDCRLNYIPPGYTQRQIAAVQANNIIDVMTTGGEKGQCDGFYRDASGQFRAVPRIHERVNNLVKISKQGAPGRFARLLNYAQGMADAYVQGGMRAADRFAGIHRVGTIPVTGRAYSWMTDRDYYSPGGSFVKIPDSLSGSLGGNRFFTLEVR